MLSCHGLKKTPPTHSVAVKYLSCQHRHREIERLHLTTLGLSVVKGVVHGVVGGALSVAQGGTFMEGFASNAIGGIAGVFSDSISQGNMFVDTAIVALAGCASASVSGGKCANGAVTAAFANMYNKWGRRLSNGGAGEPKDISDQVTKDPRLGLTVDGNTLKGTINVSCLSVSESFCAQVVSDFKEWNGTRGKYTIDLTFAVNPSKVIAHLYLFYSDKAVSYSMRGIAGDGRTITISSVHMKSNYRSDIPLSAAHEFGHFLGFDNHSSNSTMGIMSYSPNRYIREIDVQRIVEAYR